MVPPLNNKAFFCFRSKNHYGDLFQKAQYDKAELKKQRQKRSDATQAASQETLMYVICALGGLFFFFVLNGTADYDQDIIKDRNPKQTESTD